MKWYRDSARARVHDWVYGNMKECEDELDTDSLILFNEIDRDWVPSWDVETEMLDIILDEVYYDWVSA